MSEKTTSNSALLISSEKEKLFKSTRPKFELSEEKVKALSEFSRDIAKILFTSAVIGFFIPGSTAKVSALTFSIGLLFTLGFLVTGVAILPSSKKLSPKIL